MSRTVVITGSTRGIGYGLALAFAAQGCRVVINGRSQAAVDAALAGLAGQSRGEFLGVAADVARIEAVEQVWKSAVARFGRVDIWINNAGLIAPRSRFAELPFERVQAVVAANVLGTLAGSHVALRYMCAQGGGQLYNFEGFGSDGMMRPGLTTYGTTKRALRYFTRSLEREHAGGPVLIGTISPGIVATDMLDEETGQLAPEQKARARRIYNILGDRVETVAPWLAAQVLANTRHGARIAWLTPLKAAGRFLSARFRPRNVLEGVGT
jgi:NAD(P)-dependent dehydrogenase (short-subunit alcohol dehydrogenase family)